jgi:glycosyltransferase involved in cell wall biosynthesis
VTIAHDFVWLPAVEGAHRAGAASAVFVHDEWVELYGDRFRSKHEAVELYAEQLHKASRVFAVSDGMQKHLKMTYGVESEVFLPPRRKSAQRIPFQEKSTDRPFCFAYCGQLWKGYWETLRHLAATGQQHGWELDIYTNEAGSRVVGAEFSNVHVHPFLPEEELVVQLAQQADALVVALPFDEEARAMMETMFSSKLAEYTATELLVVIIGPGYAQMIQWARGAGCFLAIEELNDELIAREINRFVENVGERRAMGRASADLGAAIFSAKRAVAQLLASSARG